jgi:hypothetical protein
VEPQHGACRKPVGQLGGHPDTPGARSARVNWRKLRSYGAST